ncbi:MAG TPA: hypothetical protein VIS95_05990 [Solirubrobacterales bacterium]
MLNPSEYSQATRTATLCYEVVSLDAYWTQAAREGLVADSEGIQVVIDALDVGLITLAEHMSVVIALFEAHEERMRTVFEKAVGAPFGPDPGPDPGPFLATLQADRRREVIREAIESRGGGDPATAAIAAAESLRGSVDGERQELRAEFERASRGSASDGDISDHALKDIALIALGLGLAAAGMRGGLIEAAVALVDLIFG